MQQLLFLVSAGTGFFIALYFTLVYYRLLDANTHWVPQFCRMDEGTCSLVIRHRDAHLLGAPNFVLGLVYYCLAVASRFIASPLLDDILMYGSWLTVVLASYLLYSLLVVVKVRCTLCMVSHGVNIILALLLTFPQETA